MHDGSSASRQPPAASRTLAPVALVATAVFLIVIILSRTPLEGYVLSQKIEASDDRAVTASPLTSAQIATWLKSEVVLTAAVDQVCSRDSLAAQQDLVYDLQTSIGVNEPGDEPLANSWRLTLRHQDRQRGAQLLKKLGDSLVEQLRQLDKAESQLLVQHCQKSLAQARETEELARQSLERARNEQLAASLQLAQRSAQKPTEKAPERSPNPVWEQLNTQLAAAKARLDQLLLVRTPEHPQVIEAQAQLSLLQQQLDATSPEGVNDDSSQLPGPSLQGPQLRKAASSKSTGAMSRLAVRLVSSAEAGPVEVASLAGQIPQLQSEWTAATVRRTTAERQWNEAQQQWVRGLNSVGWQSSAVWTQTQLGGQVTHHQLLLAGVLALVAGLGAWRLSHVAFRQGSLANVDQLAENLPLPIVGEITVTTDFPRRSPERSNQVLLRVSQLSLAVLAAVVLVCAWASASDSNLSAQWSNDPLSTLGQAFDLLHHRLVG
jgi:hypothetical protein